MASVGISRARATLGALIDRARDGEEIVLTRRGQPVARLMPLEAEGPRLPGIARHWALDDAALLASTDPEDLDAAEGGCEA